jgi:hypothetical protein
MHWLRLAYDDDDDVEVDRERTDMLDSERHQDHVQCPEISFH